MFEDDFFITSTMLLIAVCALYVFGSITVGIISKQLKLSFMLGFVWSIIFTPIIGLYLVLRNNPNKKAAQQD
jgi:preprotein translocase subunit SecF